LPWLRFQVKYIKPIIIVCLGKIASRYILSEDIKISQIRGNWIERPGHFDIMPTYHPAALLRNPRLKEFMWLDMKKVKEKLDYINNI